MPRTIKLRDDTYDDLENIRQKKETYDAVVKRLLEIYNTLEAMQSRFIRNGRRRLTE